MIQWIFCGFGDWRDDPLEQELDEEQQQSEEIRSEPERHGG